MHGKTTLVVCASENMRECAIPIMHTMPKRKLATRVQKPTQDMDEEKLRHHSAPFLIYDKLNNIVETIFKWAKIIMLHVLQVLLHASHVQHNLKRDRRQIQNFAIVSLSISFPKRSLLRKMQFYYATFTCQQCMVTLLR